MRNADFEQEAMAQMRLRSHTAKAISHIAENFGFDKDWTNPHCAGRAADRLIQRLRKEGKITMRRKGRLVLWTWVDPDGK